jgi:hypothetical protein
MKTLEGFVVGVIGCAMWAAQATPQPSPVIPDFQKRVANYLQVRKSAASAVSTLRATGSPEKIQAHEHDLAISIRAARPDAAQGDIFTPGIAADFHRIIQEAWTAPGANRIKKSVTDSQPSPLPVLMVNGAYPKEDPVQSMPPSLLQRLPPLPRELEYRIVGRTLILRDIDANLIVDYLNEALP